MRIECTRLIAMMALCLSLTACATPQTTLRNPTTKQVATCGGGMVGSFAGGFIGYKLEENNDAECVNNYKKLGFKVQ